MGRKRSKKASDTAKGSASATANSDVSSDNDDEAISMAPTNEVKLTTVIMCCAI